MLPRVQFVAHNPLELVRERVRVTARDRGHDLGYGQIEIRFVAVAVLRYVHIHCTGCPIDMTDDIVIHN